MNRQIFQHNDNKQRLQGCLYLKPVYTPLQRDLRTQQLLQRLFRNLTIKVLMIKY